MQHLALAHADSAVHAAVGRRRRELEPLIRACGADVLFVAGEQARSGVVRPRVERHLDRLTCPVICLGVGSDAGRSWSFERRALVAGQVAWAADRFDTRRRAAS